MSPARSRWPARTAARALEQIWEHTSKDDALPSRAVPVLGGRARLERATCCGASLRHVSAKPIGAGKPARRFLAASSVSVIRVDPTRPPAHQCAWHLSPKCIPYSPRPRAQRAYEPRRFSGPRKPGADGQCRGPRRAFFARWGGVPARPAHGRGEPSGSPPISEIARPQFTLSRRDAKGR